MVVVVSNIEPEQNGVLPTVGQVSTHTYSRLRETRSSNIPSGRVTRVLLPMLLQASREHDQRTRADR